MREFIFNSVLKQLADLERRVKKLEDKKRKRIYEEHPMYTYDPVTGVKRITKRGKGNEKSRTPKN